MISAVAILVILFLIAPLILGPIFDPPLDISVESCLKHIVDGEIKQDIYWPYFGIPRWHNHEYISRVTGERYFMSVRHQGSLELMLYGWLDSDGLNDKPFRPKLFAAHLLSDQGDEKWLFCDTNRLCEYIRSSMDTVVYSAIPRKNADPQKEKTSESVLIAPK